jgi:Wiskott-Aldrich syndrome protein
MLETVNVSDVSRYFRALPPGFKPPPPTAPPPRPMAPPPPPPPMAGPARPPADPATAMAVRSALAGGAMPSAYGQLAQRAALSPLLGPGGPPLPRPPQAPG